MPGIKADFVNPLEPHHICGICKLVMKSPIQTNCGHMFCNDCLKQVVSNGKVIPVLWLCPIDKKEITQIFFDKACDREIQRLEVRCPYARCSGCPWTGTLRKKHRHYISCNYRDKKCSKCGSYMTQLKKHECPVIMTKCCYGIYPFFQVQNEQADDFLGEKKVLPAKGVDIDQYLPCKLPPKHYISHNKVVHACHPPPHHTAVLPLHAPAPLVSDAKDALKSMQRPLCVLPFYNEMGTPALSTQKNATVDARLPSNQVICKHFEETHTATVRLSEAAATVAQNNAEDLSFAQANS